MEVMTARGEPVVKPEWRNRIIRSGVEAPDQLLANPFNARIHPKPQQDALSGVLNSVGWIAPVIVNQRTGHVIDGHLRVSLALSKGEKTIPVDYVDLDENEEKILLASFDYIGSMAVYDREAVDTLLKQVNSDDNDVQALLAAMGDQFGIAPDVVKEAPDAQLDRAEELRDKWQTALGQLWLIGNHRLLCGDSTDAGCVERLIDGQRASLLHTDPPYGVDVVGGTRDPRDAANFRSGNSIQNDDLGDDELGSILKNAFVEARNILSPGGAYYVWHPSSRVELFAQMVRLYLAPHRQIIVWVKDNFVFGRQDYHWQHEPCFYGWIDGAAHYAIADRTQGTTWSVEAVGSDLEKKVHPTAKPVGLAVKAIKNSSGMNDIVYDPFGGSGTTMVAAEQLRRRCYMMELEPKYCAVILQRMADMGLTPQLAE